MYYCGFILLCSCMPVGEAGKIWAKSALFKVS